MKYTLTLTKRQGEPLWQFLCSWIARESKPKTNRTLRQIRDKLEDVLDDPLANTFKEGKHEVQ